MTFVLQNVKQHTIRVEMNITFNTYWINKHIRIAQYMEKRRGQQLQGKGCMEDGGMSAGMDRFAWHIEGCIQRQPFNKIRTQIHPGMDGFSRARTITNHVLYVYVYLSSHIFFFITHEHYAGTMIGPVQDDAMPQFWKPKLHHFPPKVHSPPDA